MSCLQLVSLKCVRQSAVEQSTSPIHGSKPESWFTKIGNVNKKLLAGGAILLIVLAVYPAYEHFNQSPQLVENHAGVVDIAQS